VSLEAVAAGQHAGKGARDGHVDGAKCAVNGAQQLCLLVLVVLNLVEACGDVVDLLALAVEHSLGFRGVGRCVLEHAQRAADRGDAFLGHAVGVVEDFLGVAALVGVVVAERGELAALGRLVLLGTLALARGVRAAGGQHVADDQRDLARDLLLGRARADQVVAIFLGRRERDAGVFHEADRGAPEELFFLAVAVPDVHVDLARRQAVLLRQRELERLAPLGLAQHRRLEAPLLVLDYYDKLAFFGMGRSRAGTPALLEP
jgi:hypothetical protein